ncbi:Winged helix-turn helix, partial [Lachnospiraceae bacterium NE2001]
MRRIDLNMDEQKKYEVVKRLVDEGGSKNRAALSLGITKRHLNRLINAYKEKGKAAFSHGNKGRKPVSTIPD